MINWLKFMYPTTYMENETYIVRHKFQLIIKKSVVKRMYYRHFSKNMHVCGSKSEKDFKFVAYCIEPTTKINEPPCVPNVMVVCLF